MPDEKHFISLRHLGGSCSTGEGLIEACKRSNLSQIRALLRAGVDINAQDEKEWTPLMYACCSEHKVSGHHPLTAFAIGDHSSTALYHSECRSRITRARPYRYADTY